MNFIDPRGVDGNIATNYHLLHHGWRPPPGGPGSNNRPGLGGEVHWGFGGWGRDTFYCCDGKNRWRIRTEKSCRGYAIGIGAGGTLTNLKKSDCPDGFAGEYLEIGGGPIEGTFPECGTNGMAGGVTAGCGFKFTICKYTIIEKKKIGCCNSK